MKKRMLFCFAAASACVMLGGVAQADFVTPISATASSSFNPSHAGNQLINGISEGSLSANTAGATHTEHNNANGQWYSKISATDIDLTFTLASPTNLTKAYLWQFNQTNFFDRGVNQFDIQVSTNGVDFSDVMTDQVLAISTGGLINAQTFDFGSVQTNVTTVRIHIDSNHGNTITGLSEVRFEGVAVPEPSSLALFGLGVVGLITRRHRA